MGWVKREERKPKLQCLQVISPVSMVNWGQRILESWCEILWSREKVVTLENAGKAEGSPRCGTSLIPSRNHNHSKLSTNP
jgi:hypothetical protein